jgi:DNA-binding transcriptional MerR regulator/predicted transcriptional regulator YdeE
MFAIGAFSRLSQVTIKTLRYYDEAGLFQPARVDPASGYRFYSAAQLPRLHRILVLKELGFSLEQIRGLIREGVDAAELSGMLRLRRAEQAERLREEEHRLRTIETLIEEIRMEGQGMDVIIKEASARWVLSVRGTVPNYQSIGMLYGEVYAQAGAAGVSATPIAIWHDPEQKDSNVEGEAGLLVDRSVAAKGRVKSYQIPASVVASYIHHGAFDQFKGVYSRMMRWLESNGYQVSGPCREIYLELHQPVQQDDARNVTEIQIPVAKAA